MIKVTLANVLNFIFDVILIVCGLYLLEVPTAENLLQFAQHMLGMISIAIVGSFKLFKGE